MNKINEENFSPVISQITSLPYPLRKLKLTRPSLTMKPAKQTNILSDHNNPALPACAVVEKYSDILRNQP